MLARVTVFFRCRFGLRALLVSKEDCKSGDVDSFVSPSGLPLQKIQKSTFHLHLSYSSFSFTHRKGLFSPSYTLILRGGEG